MFFEYALSNPTSDTAHVRVEHSCAELRVVHNADEWAHHKAAAGLPGRVERHMFRKKDDGKYVSSVCHCLQTATMWV